MTKNVLILDDHPLIIDGIKIMLSGTSTYKVINAYSTINELLNNKNYSQGVDIIILDLNVKGDNSLEYIDSIKKIYPKSKIIAFTSYDDSSLVKKCIEKNLDGYILKDTTKKELLGCFESIHNGHKHFQQQVYENLDTSDLLNHKSDIVAKKYNLSNREKDILKMLIKGDSEKVIAEKLFLSKHTIHSHNKNIKRKLNVKNIIQMVNIVHQSENIWH